MADFGGGYYGDGPRSTWGRWLWAVGCAVVGIVALIAYDGAGKGIFATLLFACAAVFALGAVFGPRLEAWGRKRREQLKGTWGNE